MGEILVTEGVVLSQCVTLETPRKMYGNN
uniref:Uncharacterized protein n=1 Tax=Vitis vinifera TaxID=29760 RepID=F6HWM6_VITVI